MNKCANEFLCLGKGMVLTVSVKQTGVPDNMPGSSTFVADTVVSASALE